MDDSVCASKSARTGMVRSTGGATICVSEAGTTAPDSSPPDADVRGTTHRRTPGHSDGSRPSTTHTGVAPGSMAAGSAPAHSNDAPSPLATSPV